MNLTEEQRAYHLRKIRTRYERMDINKDGYLSREDYELMSKRLIENTSEITSEQADKVRNAFLAVADKFDLKPGIKTPLEEAAKKASDKILSTPTEKWEGMLSSNLIPIFNAIDTNNSGFISVDEFKVYLHAMTPAISDANIKRSFNAIDADKDGSINYEEFFAAAKDFLGGVEVTEISETFMGPLL